MNPDHKKKLLALAESWRQRAKELKRSLRTQAQREAIGESKHSVNAAVAAYEDRADELERAVAACE